MSYDTEVRVEAAAPECAYQVNAPTTGFLLTWSGDDRMVTSPPWGLRLGGSIQLAMHTVVRGLGCLWLSTPGNVVELSPGTVALVHGGQDHHIGHESGADCLEPEEFRTRYAQAGSGDNPQVMTLSPSITGRALAGCSHRWRGGG